MTVINFDVAKNLDIHTHRVGRAGRMSAIDEGNYKRGNAYTLMTRKDADFANLLMENFIKEGRTIDDELKNLARYSKFFGRSGNNGNGSAKKQIHGIGWNRDQFGNQAKIGPVVEGKNSKKTASQAATNDNPLDYYGPSSSTESHSKTTNAHAGNKRKQWG